MLRSTSGTTKAHTTGSTFTVAFAAILFRGVARVSRLLSNRIAVARLSDLDERALKDIGLTPSDVRAALALPLSFDPSEHLREVAGHKRARHVERAGSAVSINRLRAGDADVSVPAVKACPV